MIDLLPELVRQWQACVSAYGRLPLADQVSLFLQFNAGPLFANESAKLGQSPMSFVEDMVWEAIRQSGTHTDDEIATARRCRDG